jgi:hypothetical protein
VQTFYNKEPLTGGSDLETLEATIDRGQVALRSRDVLVSATDYEIKAQELLGQNSKATAIPLLTSDRITEKEGNVHVFLIGDLLTPPSSGTCLSIQSALQELTFVASRVWVSPYSIFEIDCRIVCEVEQISRSLAEEIYSAIKAYLDPFAFPLGGTVRYKELEYVARSVGGVSGVTDLLLNGAAINVIMPYRYSFPSVATCELTLTNGPESQVYNLGAGGDTD